MLCLDNPEGLVLIQDYVIKSITQTSDFQTFSVPGAHERGVVCGSP
jgi:hypothetical protein